MNLPEIAVINFSNVSDRDVQHAVRAVNRQVVEDFLPIWGSGYICQLLDSSWGLAHESVLAEDPVTAAGVIYVVDESHLEGAMGYHDMNASEVPYGFVFTDLGDWTITLSHEVLEMIVDPNVNIFVPGPDPRHPQDTDRWLLHSYEVCDAVERTSYFIDGVELSNFVTPQYFREGDAPGTRNDFLGVGVESFGLTDGSHLGVVNPEDFGWETINGFGEWTPAPLKVRFDGLCSAQRRSRVGDDDKMASLLTERFLKCVSRAKNPGTQRMSGLSRGQRYESAAFALKRRRLGSSS